MPRASILAVVLGLATLGLPHAGADHFCSPTPAIAPIGDAGYHVSDGGPAEGYAASGWLYLESNAILGLQRGGVAILGGNADPCPAPDVEPDTLLSGIALDAGDPPATAPFPGLLGLFQAQGQPPILLNPLDLACGPVSSGPTGGGSVTCGPPATLPPGFAAGCDDQRVFAHYGATPLPTNSIQGQLSCGAAAASCASPSGATGCAATATGPGTLPATCSATLQPGTYFAWAVWCLYG